MLGVSEASINPQLVESPRKSLPKWAVILLALAAVLVVSVLVWQGITSAGSPDPTKANTTPASAIFDIAVLVFREGLECILVLSAITASMTGAQALHRRPVAAGAGIGFIATVITWFVAIGILNDLGSNVSALNLQAATGLLAVGVLLVVMNWFFHKMYWGGWICLHNKKKKELLKKDSVKIITTRSVVLGLGLLGFSSFYREGFEVVLFLQGYRMQLGSQIVLTGAALGAALTGIVAVLTFIAHQRLPYRKMLILTGILLGGVLLVMVGEQAQEMQLAHWIPTTTIDSLTRFMPDWMGVWFGVIPTRETLIAQGLAAVLVIGSYFGASRTSRKAAPPECSVSESGACAPENCEHRGHLSAAD